MSKLTTPRRETFSHEIVGLSIDFNSQLTNEDAPFDGDIDRLRRRAMELREKLKSLRREGESLNRLAENGIIDNLANMPHSNANKTLGLAASPESASTSASDSPTKRKRQQSPSSASSDRHALPAARPPKPEYRRSKRQRVSVEEHKQHMDKEQSAMQSSYDHVCELLTEVDEEIARAKARRLRLEKWKEDLMVWGLEESNFKDRLENQSDC